MDLPFLVMDLDHRCRNLSAVIREVARYVNTTAEDWEALQLALTSLQKDVHLIRRNFGDPRRPLVALQLMPGYEAQFYENVKRSMEDCAVTLRSLEREVRFSRPASSQRKSDLESRNMTLLKEQVSTYRKVMHLSSVYIP